MDSRERRRTTAETARLGLLGFAIVALLLGILGQSLRHSHAAADLAGELPLQQEPRLPGASLAPTPGALAFLEDRAPGDQAFLEEQSSAPFPEWQRALDPGLSKRVASLVDEALSRAKKLSAGRVRAANTTVAVHITHPASRQELVARRSDAALIPASNMKLVTSAAALVLLSSSWNFETRFESPGEIEAGHLRGDLIVRAGGDPFFDAEAHGEAQHLFAPLLESLRKAGVSTIDGDLVLDEGSYLEPGPGPAWPSENQYWQEYCARSGGFSVNAGCLTAFVRSGRVGALALAEVRPLEHGLKRVGEVHTAARGARLDIAVGAVPGCVTLRGSIPAGIEPWSTRFAAPDPLRLFASVLMAALEAGGIAVAGDAVQLRGAPPGRLLANLRTPLLEVLAPINLHSNNAVADQLFFALGDAVGGAGTRAGGQAATRRALTELGLPAGGLVQVDGSGLSRDSRLTARQLTALLSATANLDGATFEYFYRSLPVAGESGSLLGRMTSGPARGRVHAKTGWIGGASALSGFVETAQGKRLVFSILVSYPRESGLNTSCWKPMQDAICAALVNWNG